MTNTMIVRKLSALSLPWPTDWPRLFDEAAPRPLIVEIGFGYGQMLAQLSRQHPDAHIVGLEISNECLERAERAIARGALPNVRVIFSWAETALHHLFTPASIDALHINFPDPWFKSRHERRRLMGRDTLDAMVSRLKPGGDFYLATDIRDYAEMSAELLAETPGLANQFATPWVERWPDDLPPRALTKYEARGFAEGRGAHYFYYRRTAEAVAPVPVIEEVEMPHRVITTPLSLDAIRAQFAPFTATDEAASIHANVQFVFRGDRSLLFEAFVAEPTVEQRVALMLIHNPDSGDYTVRLGQIGNPRPTDGMHVLVRALSDWVLSLHPDGRIIHDKTRGG
jgi:tRNA (guanine-N7-)-methyltransferase